MDYPLHYYDLVLVAIISSIAMGVGVGAVTPVSMSLGVGVFGVVAVALISQALFVNGPVDDVDDLTREVEPEKLPGATPVAQVIE